MGLSSRISSHGGWRCDVENAAVLRWGEEPELTSRACTRNGWYHPQRRPGASSCPADATQVSIVILRRACSITVPVTTVATASPLGQGQVQPGDQFGGGAAGTHAHVLSSTMCRPVGQPVERMADVDHRNVQRAVQPFQVGQHLGFARWVSSARGVRPLAAGGACGQRPAMATRWRPPISVRACAHQGAPMPSSSTNCSTATSRCDRCAAP